MRVSTSKYAGAVRLCLAAVLVAAASGVAFAQAPQVKKPSNGMLILGSIESIAVDDMSDPASGGRVVVDDKKITIPKNILIGLPAGKRMTLRDLVLDAPEACKSLTPPQSGLAVSDSCRRDAPPALARIVATPSESGALVATIVMVQKNSATTLARFSKARPSRAKRNPGGQEKPYPGGQEKRYPGGQ